MHINHRLRIAKYGYIVLSLLLCILGIVLIAVPDFSVSLLCWIGGILLILFGSVKILGYISKERFRLAFQFDLAFGILLIALGLVLILRTDAMVSIICMLLGIAILADALLKIQIALDTRTLGISQWWMILTTAIITGIAGFLLLFRPYESARAIMLLLGISFLAEGLLNLVTVMIAAKVFHNRQNWQIDGDIIL